MAPALTVQAHPTMGKRITVNTKATDTIGLSGANLLIIQHTLTIKGVFLQSSVGKRRLQWGF